MVSRDYYIQAFQKTPLKPTHLIFYVVVKLGCVFPKKINVEYLYVILDIFCEKEEVKH